MTSPNPLFPQQIGPFRRMNDETVSATSAGTCDALGFIACEGTTDPENVKQMLIRGNTKVVGYVPEKENGVESRYFLAIDNMRTFQPYFAVLCQLAAALSLFIGLSAFFWELNTYFQEQIDVLTPKEEEA